MAFRLIDPTTLYILIGGVLVIIVGLALRHAESLQKSLPLWLWSGLAGILLGAGSSAVVVYWLRPKPALEAPRRVTPQERMNMMIASGTMPGMGGGGGIMGGRGSGGMGGTATGGPGGGGSRARRELPALIGKLELLTRGLHLNLESNQLATLASAIEGLDEEEEMSEEAAKEHLDTINEILTAENTELLASIELPRSGRGGATGGQLVAAAPVGRSMLTIDGGNPALAGGPGTRQNLNPGGTEAAGAGGGGQLSDENPFKQEDNARRLQRLREQIAGAR